MRARPLLTVVAVPPAATAVACGSAGGGAQAGSVGGAVFHAARGFEVDADIATGRGRKVRVSGTLSC